MPVTKTITLYKFEELPTEKACQAAMDWWLGGVDDVASAAFEQTVYDAELIGLKLKAGKFGMREAEFENDATDCAGRIMKEHGADCETYKDAVNFLAAQNEALKVSKAKDNDEDGLEAEIIELEEAFLKNLVKDYEAMYEKEIEYQSSPDVVSETLIANEYTFTETGKREDV
jgi:hypothetical protein